MDRSPAVGPAWTGGGQNGNGSTVLAAGSTATVDATLNGSVTLDFGRRFVNNGTLSWNGGNLNGGCCGATNGYAISNAGIWTVGGSGSNSFTYGGCCGPITFANGGTLTKTGSGTLTFNPHLTNTGTFNLTNGIVAMATNSLTLAAGSVIGVSINGTGAAGVGYGQLAISNGQALSGALAVTSNFVPTAGSVFQVVTCSAGCAGTFAPVAFTPNTTIYAVTYPGASVTLTK